MKKRLYCVEPVWDDEAKVFISKGDVVGLHIEADTLEEFERLVNEFAPDLIVANHMSETNPTNERTCGVMPEFLVKPPVRHTESTTR